MSTPTATTDPWLENEWDAVEDAFDAVYALPEGDREAAVDALPDGPVKRGVLVLFAAEPPPPAPRPRRGHVALPNGTPLGRFVVRRRVGEGGTAVVFAAEDPVLAQKAAVKVLSSEDPDDARRFAREQALLAPLDHEAVPTLLDSGSTPDGRPYFAMELVHGVPITAFARSRSLGTVRRLELFALLCDAVRYVHRRGVVHRDVKPSNVFASEEDGRLRVHLLDFGVAKPLTDSARGPAGGGLTGAGVAPATPAYAAPEQRGGRSTTGTDVFALGLVLYELMTGERPVDVRERRGAPSASVDLGVGRGEAWAIDTVVERAIDPDPGRRYASADDLLRDVRRVLGGRSPAGAGRGWAPAALWFGGRRVGLAAAALAVFTFVVALALTDRRWRSSAEAASAAQDQVVAVATDVVRSQLPAGPEGREFLVGAAEAARDGLRDAPEAEADLALAIADQLAARGACGEAVPLYGRAVLLRSATDPDHPVAVAGYRGQARCAAGPIGTGSASQARRAAEHAEQALALARSRYGPRSAVAAAVAVDLALYLVLAGDPVRAADVLASAEAALAVAGSDPRGEARRFRRVQERAGSSDAAFPDVAGEDGPALTRARAGVVAAVALMARAAYGPAAARARRAVAPLVSSGGAPGMARRTGPWAETVAFGLTTGAEALRRDGELGPALDAAERATSVLALHFGEGDPRTVRARAASAALAAERGADPDAQFYAVVRGAEALGDDGLLGAVLAAQGWAFVEAGRSAEARSALERAVTVGQGAEPRPTSRAYAALADLDRAVGDVAGALDRSERAVELAQALTPSVGLSLGALLTATVARADALLAAGRPSEAVGVLGPVLRAAESAPGGAARPSTIDRARGVLRTATERG
ncbi:serine/threonine-protein kinase [Rubrivirga sp. S365]|uniref:serine/threonine-protein kinase n=1 Tax=Rubrivirga sp. S365 TaxID=3076080 RepID=UPI0028C7FF9A|nr:serine/threonine-protein kinase [Rubrivirga sp. S365]MDT7858207.1 serine/threonine-protein kinase [Rubrivirga sp. S365]